MARRRASVKLQLSKLSWAGRAGAKTLAEAERLPVGDQPFIPVAFYESKNMVSTPLNGWRDKLLDRHVPPYQTIEPRGQRFAYSPNPAFAAAISARASAGS